MTRKRDARQRVTALALVGAALVAASTSGGAGSARAAFPGQNGKLVYYFEREIWTANADGSDARQLTLTPGLDRSPSWSPDGTKIAFASERNGQSKIFVMNADGSDPRQVSFAAGRDRTSAWTADGRQVIYDKEFTELYVVNADGSGGDRKLANGWGPSASPHGDRLAFTGGSGGVVTMNLDGSDPRAVTESGQADFGPRLVARWNRSRLHSLHAGRPRRLSDSLERRRARPADEHARPLGGGPGLVPGRHEDRLRRLPESHRQRGLRDLRSEP